MKALSLFYPYVEPEVMGCPHPVISHHLLLAIRDFCQRGLAWREWADPSTADGTTNTFDYDLDSSQEIVKVARALRNDCPLAPLSEDQLPNNWQDTDPCHAWWRTDCVVHFDDASFMVFPTPSAGDEIRLELVLQPTITATGVGDVLFDTYADQVANGTKARLMRMANKPWSNPSQAGGYAMQFESDITRAANRDFAMRGKEGRRSKPLAMWNPIPYGRRA